MVFVFPSLFKKNMKRFFYVAAICIATVLLTAGKDRQVKALLIGDSTMADKPVEDNPERGWGMVLPSYFDEGVVVENYARNGRSSRTFIAEGRWALAMSRVSPGDYVVLQFGHNDEVETKKAYTPYDQYKANFERFVREVRAKGANPILCTPVARRKFDSIGNPIDTHPIYPKAIRDVAREMNVPLIDMLVKSTEVLKKYGPEASKKLFMHIEPGIWKKVPDGRKDDTHFVEAGAMEMARCFTDGLRELKISGLTNHLLKPEAVKPTLTNPTPDPVDVKNAGKEEEWNKRL